MDNRLLLFGGAVSVDVAEVVVHFSSIFAVCSWNGVVGVIDVDLRSLEGYSVRMKVGEWSQIWGVGGVSAVNSRK